MNKTKPNAIVIGIAAAEALKGKQPGARVTFACPICGSDATAYKAENGHKSARCDNCDHTIRQ